MEIDKQTTRAVARLARLGLSDEVLVAHQAQLSTILGYVQQLNKVDTDGVPPMAQATGQVNDLAEDEILNEHQDTLPVDSPALEGTSIKVKGVFRD
ncbi:MAG: Asp-tRNA(Asn)/Glu-tRNA(Gln) amidotransferase subunit GatC [Patescibacteria group bacterium]